jgi:hypothetical protein
MKKISYIIGVLIGLTIVFHIQSCGGGGEPTPIEKTKSLLTSGKWTMQSVTVDGATQTSVYAGLTITFTEGNFTTTNGRVVWPATGTWTFVGDDAKNIIRGDDLTISIDEISATQLSLKLTWDETTLGGGRSQSVAGVNVFRLGR